MKFFKFKIFCRKKVLIWVFILLFLSSFLIYFNFKEFHQSIQLDKTDKKTVDCVTEERLVTVKGNSLSGLIEDNKVLKILVGYYQCHPIKTNDIVAYTYFELRNSTFL